MKIFLAIFLLAMVGFPIKVCSTAKAAYIDGIEHLCAPEKDPYKWAFLTPPTGDKDNATTDNEKASAKQGKDLGKSCRGTAGRTG